MLFAFKNQKGLCLNDENSCDICPNIFIIPNHQCFLPWRISKVSNEKTPGSKHKILKVSAESSRQPLPWAASATHIITDNIPFISQAKAQQLKDQWTANETFKTNNEACWKMMRHISCNSTMKWGKLHSLESCKALHIPPVNTISHDGSNKSLRKCNYGRYD